MEWSVAPAVTLTNPGPQSSTEGDAVSLAVPATDSTGGALTYSATGLPSGLGIDPNSGTIAGAAAAGDAAAGPYTVTVTAADGTYAGSDVFTWNVVAGPVCMTDPEAQTSTEGAAVSLPIHARDANGSALLYTAVGLPPGLKLNPTSGLISGVVAPGAAASGPYTVTVTAVDADGYSASQTFQWDVAPAVTMSCIDPQFNAEGDQVNFQVGAMDATHGTLTFGATGLPAGLAIDPATGLISGTVAAGKPWLGIFPTVPGNVLIIDNELHPETIAHHLRAVANANGVEVSGDDRAISLWPLRGRLQSVYQIAEVLKERERGEFSFIIFDAFYRVLPPGTDENSNADMPNIYNAIDSIAESTGAASALVHHASKGNQSEKSVTDVGSGAGSISRAADTHLILRRHQEDGAYVLDVAVRSWPPAAPLCLRWRFPQWELAPDLDPAALWTARKPAKKEETPFDGWDAERVANLCPPEPTHPATVLFKASRAGLSERKAKGLLAEAISQGLLREVPRAGKGGGRNLARAPLTPPVGNGSYLRVWEMCARKIGRQRGTWQVTPRISGPTSVILYTRRTGTLSAPVYERATNIRGVHALASSSTHHLYSGMNGFGLNWAST